MSTTSVLSPKSSLGTKTLPVVLIPTIPQGIVKLIQQYGCGPAVVSNVPETLRNYLSITMARRTYKACRTLLSSPRWDRVNDLGARPRRPLRASTETKNPSGSDIPYVNTLPAPFTVNTVPEGALRLSSNTPNSVCCSHQTEEIVKR